MELVTVILVFVTLKVMGTVPLKPRTVTMFPLLSPCAAAVVIMAVLPESRWYLAEVGDTKDAAADVGVTVGSGNPRS